MTHKDRSRALLDNWCLELSGHLLQTEAIYAGRISRKRPIDIYYHQAMDDNGAMELDLLHYNLQYSFPEYFHALCNLVDAIILNDRIFVDKSFAYVWRDKFPEVLSPILSLVEDVDIKDFASSDGIKDKETQYLGHQLLDGLELQFARRLSQYLFLSQELDAFYWPSPRRKQYIKGEYYTSIKSFSFEVKQKLSSFTNEIYEETFSRLAARKPDVTWIGLASNIILESENASEILPNAMTVRNSKVGIEVRDWIRRGSNAVRDGNVTQIVQFVDELEDVMSSTRRSIGLDKAGSLAKVNIGLSPGVAFDVSRSTLKPNFKKPLHLTFLKDHANKFFKNSDLEMRAKAVFGRMIERM